MPVGRVAARGLVFFALVFLALVVFALEVFAFVDFAISVVLVGGGPGDSRPEPSTSAQLPVRKSDDCESWRLRVALAAGTARGRNVGTLDVVHHHPVGTEAPAQGADGPLHT